MDASGKEIAGLKKKKKKKNMIMMTRNRVRVNSLVRARRKSWGICIARYWPLDYC